ncbi:hypothetical protein Gohar_006954, partial [Gossypium harknessii]|nr:hypothetical protein [Gossypium harknessii]
LQLGLPVDRLVVTRSVVTVNWRDVYKQLLGRVLDTIFRGRLDMNWLKGNFVKLDARNHGPGYVALSEELKDIQLLLDQRLDMEFGFRKMIMPTNQDIKDPYNIDLQGRTDENRVTFLTQYINIWNHKYNFIPNREPIISQELACDPEYMPWFRHHGKPYLLSEVVRGTQCHTRRSGRVPQNLRPGTVAEARPSLTPT